MITERFFDLLPRDPLIARDGRPFGAGGGNRMRPLKWLYPQVTAGVLRTAVGRTVEGGFTPDLIRRLKLMEVGGPLPVWQDELYLPAPSDCVLFPQKGSLVRQAVRAEPCELDDCGTDLPPGLMPVMLDSGTRGKPVSGAEFWSISRLAEWLLDGKLSQPQPAEIGAEPASGYFQIPKHDERWHVMIRPKTRTAEDERLFLTAGNPLPDGMRLALRYRHGDAELGEPDDWSTVGGERRLAQWKRGTAELWRCPSAVAQGLANAKYIRMILATPAMFSNGWLPGWIDAETMKGVIPGTDQQVRICAAICDRWLPVSGFSYDRTPGKFGRRPIRRLVPSGAVYFLERLGTGTISYGDLWLRSVSDFKDDIFDARHDGYGLAVWGRWPGKD